VRFGSKLAYVLAAVWSIAALEASAQAYSAHSTSLAVAKSDRSPPVIYNPHRDVRLFSEDGSQFKLQFPGCVFDVSVEPIDPEIEAIFRPSFEKHLTGTGWIGGISFIGKLTNPVRNDLADIMLHDFRCDTSRIDHLIAISPWEGDTPLEQLGVLKRLAILDYQMDASTMATTNYFITLREDVATLKNLNMLGKFGRALRGDLK